MSFSWSRGLAHGHRLAALLLGHTVCPGQIISRCQILVSLRLLPPHSKPPCPLSPPGHTPDPCTEYMAPAALQRPHHTVQPGDCIVLNAPNSTVGRAILQLARLLKLRVLALLKPSYKPRSNPPLTAAAVASDAAVALSAAAAGGPVVPGNAARGGVGVDGGEEDEAWFSQLSARLLALGATHVLRDEGPIRVGSLAPCFSFWLGQDPDKCMHACMLHLQFMLVLKAKGTKAAPTFIPHAPQ